MKLHHIASSAILSLLLMLSACARPPAPVERPVPVPFDTAGLKQRSDYWRDYRAKFRLKVESKTANFSVRAIVLVKGGNFARFETFGPIGQAASLFVLNETGPALFIPSEKVIFTAAQPETLIRHFLGVSLPFDTFRHALSASIPEEQLDGLDTRMEGKELHAVRNVGPRLFDWRFVPKGPSLTGLHVRGEDFKADITYDPPVPLAPASVTRDIRISSSDWNMEITVEEIVPEHEFRPTVFYLPKLPEMKVVDLDRIK